MPVNADVKLKTLSYVIVYVKDTKKSVPFYRDTLGFPVRLDDQGWVEFETGACIIALHHDEKFSAPTQNAPLPVFESEDIYGTYEALKAKGVKFNGEPKTVCEYEGKVGKSIDFQDPDGNHLSIFGYCKK